MLGSRAWLDAFASARDDGPMSEPTLAGERVVLRPARTADRLRLRAILGQAEVARWWGPGGPDHAVDDWLAKAQGGGSQASMLACPSYTRVAPSRTK